MPKVVVWLSLWVSVLLNIGVAVACWLQTSVVGWLTNLAAQAIVLVLTVGYDLPGRHLLRRPFQWFSFACAVGALLSVVRLGNLGWPHISSTAMGLIVCIGVLLAYLLAGLREPGARRAAVSLASPFATGSWVVASGGVSMLNHHLSDRRQAAALDLMAIRDDGARAAGVCPEDLDAYASYGIEVLSPCQGTILEAVYDEPERPAHTPHPETPNQLARLGNRVVIESTGTRVVLGHLQPGPPLVMVGDAVDVGTPLGAVGNSGRSVEPHLHLHAERDGDGVRIRFSESPRRRPRTGGVILPDRSRIRDG